MNPTGTSVALVDRPAPVPPAVEDRGWDLPARQPSVVAWCDRHLAAMISVQVITTDQPGNWAQALTGVLADSLPHAPDGVAPERSPSNNLFGHRCPDGTAAIDRVELALLLMDEHSSGECAHVTGLPESLVDAELRWALRVLGAPCEEAEAGQGDARP